MAVNRIFSRAPGRSRTLWSRLLLPVFAVMAASGPVLACMDEGRDVSYGGTYRPFRSSINGVPAGLVMGPLSGGLPARTLGFIRMGILAAGDHWDIPESGSTAQLTWRIQAMGNGEPDSEALRVWLWGEAEGIVKIPVRYLPATGRPLVGNMVIHVDPPPPPPEPRTLVVEGEQFSGFFDQDRRLLIRLKTPLAANHRWDVKEAAYSDRSSGDDDSWQSLAIERSPREADLFMTAPRGQRIRIVFIQRRDGWQLFPDTVTLLLTAYPVPKC